MDNEHLKRLQDRGARPNGEGRNTTSGRPEQKGRLNPLQRLQQSREARAVALQEQNRIETERKARDREASRERAVTRIKLATDSEPSEARPLSNFVGLADYIELIARDDPERAVNLAGKLILRTIRHNAAVARLIEKESEIEEMIGRKKAELAQDPLTSLRINFGKRVSAANPNEGITKTTANKITTAAARIASFATELLVRRSLALINGQSRAALNTIQVDDEALHLINPEGESLDYPLDKTEGLRFSVDPFKWLDTPLGWARLIPSFSHLRSPIGIIRVREKGEAATLLAVPAVWKPDKKIAQIVDALNSTQPFDPDSIPDFIPIPKIGDLLRKGGRVYTELEAGQETN